MGTVYSSVLSERWGVLIKALKNCILFSVAMSLICVVPGYAGDSSRCCSRDEMSSWNVNISDTKSPLRGSFVHLKHPQKPDEFSTYKSAEEYARCVHVLGGFWAKKIERTGELQECTDPYDNSCFCEMIIKGGVTSSGSGYRTSKKERLDSPKDLANYGNLDEYMYCVSVLRGKWVRNVKDSVEVCNDPYDESCFCETVVR